MTINRYILLSTLATIGILLIARIALWHLVLSSARIVSYLLTLLATCPIWTRTAPIRSRVQIHYPRAYAILKARLHPSDFKGLPLTLMCLAALYAMALLSGLVDDLREAEGVVQLDEGVNVFFVPYRVPWLVEVFTLITALGAGPAITAVASTTSALLWSQRRGRLLLPMWIAFVGAQSTTWVSKYAIGRARPIFLDGVTATNPSFPSGHATASTALYGFLAYLIARDLPRPRQRFEVIFWAATLIGLICFSRIFLSLHYLSDVVAGVLVGAFWLLVSFTVAQLSQRHIDRRTLPGVPADALDIEKDDEGSGSRSGNSSHRTST